MATISHTALLEVKHADADDQLPAELSYAETQVYRALLFSRMGKGRFPNSTQYNPRRLTMRINGFRDQNGVKPISVDRVRRIVSTLRSGGYVAFQPSRQRRKPTRDGFLWGKFIKCLVAPDAVRYASQGRHKDQTHHLARLQKHRDKVAK